MDLDKIVVYQAFIDPIYANIVKGLLDSYGIECFLSDECMVTLNALYSPAVGGVKLHVFEKDIGHITALLQAQNIIDEPEMPAANEDNKITCPVCHSGNVSYGGSINRKFNSWHVFISFLLMLYPIAMRKAYHCFDCDHEFKKR
jgi:Putative prokaryotic signal transducing protein